MTVEKIIIFLFFEALKLRNFSKKLSRSGFIKFL